MEFLIIIGIAIGIALLSYYVFDYQVKQMKEIAENKELDDIAQKYPENIQIAKEYLKLVHNEKVEIEENKEAESSLYIAITDKIVIGNIASSYTRIQTIAHECLHSIQDRKLLVFQFIFSNIYLIYFIIIVGLAIFKLIPCSAIFLVIFLLLAMVFYMVRTYLENDAMIKAPFLAKEYMEKKQISSPEEIEKIMQGFMQLNQLGIKAVQHKLFLSILVKLIILSSIFFIFS